MVKATVHPSEKFEGVQEKVFHLENENGKLLLEVPVRRIICYEANDNYVITYYLNEEEQLKKSMERISLKKIEEILHSEGVEFARVHKSYLINVDYLSDIKGRSQAYRIQLRFFEELIPVSRAFDISTLPRVK
jgi:DNA-binding LytR/AlgR family response regulator